MRKTKGKGEAKTKAKTRGKPKSSPKSPAKRPRNRNRRGDQPLSFDSPLIEITQDHDLPPLTIEQVETADDGGVAKRGWAVVSADPQRPLTEREAKHIVAAMRRPRTSAPIRIAAE